MVSTVGFPYGEPGWSDDDEAHAHELLDYAPHDASLSEAETDRWFRQWTGNPVAPGSLWRIVGSEGSGGLVGFRLVREDRRP